MKKVTLSQILQYLADETPIQVVMYGQEWEKAEEFTADSEFLKPFYNYVVMDMGSEESWTDGSPTIRVSIKADQSCYCCFAA